MKKIFRYMVIEPVRLFADLFLGVFEVVLILIMLLRTPKGSGYEANFLPAIKILKPWNKSFRLNGIGSVSLIQGYSHAAIFGQPGMGKTTTIITPSIYAMARHGSSFVIHDPAREILKAVGAFLILQGYRIEVLDYNRPHAGYNPLLRANTVSEIYKVITILISSSLGKSSKDAFWNNQAISFCSLVVMVLKKHPQQYHNLHNLKYLIDAYQANPDLLDRLVAETKDPLCLREYKNFLKGDAKVMANIISTCRAALMLLNSEGVQRVTSFDSIDFDSFRKDKVALFIQNNVGDTSFYAPLTSCFTTQFFARIMEDPIRPKTDRSIHFILDETPAIRIPGDVLQTALAQVRKSRVGILLLCQDKNQLIDLYGEAQARAIISCCYSKVYFANQPLETARELEALLGKYEHTDKDGKKQVRNLMSADAIRTMGEYGEKYALIFCGANRGIFAYMRPYFKRFKYRRYAKMIMPEIERKTSFDPIPLIGEGGMK